MTTTENRAAGRAYAAEKRLRFEEERERAGRAADMEALRVIRHYLIFQAKTRDGEGRNRLITAIDDYAGRDHRRPHGTSQQDCKHRALNVLGCRIFQTDSCTR
jgi:hypothetical protein